MTIFFYQMRNFRYWSRLSGMLIILWKCHSWTESSLFYVSELKKLDKLSFYVMLYLSEHFHQKIRKHASVIAGTTLQLLIYRTFFS